MENKQKLSIVWDVTKCCPWNCAICCMGAEASKEKCQNELSFEEKLKVANQLKKLQALREVHVDLSGGEIMTDLRNLDLVDAVSKALGRDKVGISTSGYLLSEDVAKRLSVSVKDVEMTMDTLPSVSYSLRPKGYAGAAAKAVPILKEVGIEVGIQTVLARRNTDEASLRALYGWLCEHRVEHWSLLRFYPSGRGARFAEEQLTEEESLACVNLIYRLERESDAGFKPEIDFHYSIKGHRKYSEECRCVKKSIGILPDGTVTSCFWASDEQTKLTGDKFYLGNVRTDSLFDILSGTKAAYWMKGCHRCELQSA